MGATITKINGSAPGKVVSVNVNNTRGFKKGPTNEALLVKEYGMWGDIHGGESPNKQVSLLPFESIQNHSVCPKIKKINGHYFPGDFGENITLKGIDFQYLGLNSKILIGNDIVLKITKVGRHCKMKCKYNHTNEGGCFLRCEGIFGSILKGGVVKNGDEIKIIKSEK